MRLAPVLALLLLPACRRDAPRGGEMPPDIVLEQATVQQYRGSQTQLVARTPSLSFYRQGALSGQVEATDVVVEVKTNGLRIEAERITGDAIRGALDGRTVRATTPTGTKVSSPAAHFDRSLGAEGTATTDAGVLVTHPSFTLEAQSGSVDLETQRAALEQVRSRTGR